MLVLWDDSWFLGKWKTSNFTKKYTKKGLKINLFKDKDKSSIKRSVRMHDLPVHFGGLCGFEQLDIFLYFSAWEFVKER